MDEAVCLHIGGVLDNGPLNSAHKAGVCMGHVAREVGQHYDFRNVGILLLLNRVFL